MSGRFFLPFSFEVVIECWTMKIKKSTGTVGLPTHKLDQNLIYGGIFMAKYSTEFKLKVVTEDFKGEMGYVKLAKKFNIPSKCLREWGATYRVNGSAGIARSRQQKKILFNSNSML